MRANQVTGKVPAKNHKGWGCQLYSTAGVMQWLSDRYSPEISSIPARKRDKQGAGVSLRQLLKQKYQSAAGEINNAHDLASVAREQENIAASVIDCQNQEAYFQIIMRAIDNNLPPVVFFDVDDNGLPACAQGKREHAAVVIGYYHDSFNNLKLTLLQWEKFYEVDAAALFQSNDQLVADHEQALFVKTRTRRGEGAWFPMERMIEYFSHGTEIFKYRFTTSPTYKEGFKNKILLLDVDMSAKMDKLFADLSKRASEISKDQGSLAQAKIAALRALHAKLDAGLTNKESLFALVQEWKNIESPDCVLKNNWQVICEQRYKGVFSFFNPQKTATEKLIDDVFATSARMTSK